MSSPELLLDALAAAAEAASDSYAMVAGDQRITYASLMRRIDATTAALLAIDVSPGDRVATLSPPHPDALIAFFATVSIGAVWVGMNPKYRPPELAHVAADADPAVLLVGTIPNARDESAAIKAVTGASSSIRTVQRLETFTAEKDIDDSALSGRRATDAGTPCLLVYTSGSTGVPKGAMLHPRGIVRFAREQNRLWPVAPRRALNFFPINHVGCIVDVSCPVLIDGGTLVFHEQFDAAETLRSIERERVTLWGSVPSTFELQLRELQRAYYDLESVQLLVWEGAAMPEATIRRLRRFCTRMASNYGLTEATSAITYVEPTSDIDVLGNTVGRAFPDTEIRLVDDSNRDVEAGATGEILARGPSIMIGYRHNEKATNEAIDRDGWLHTGDLARLRSDDRYQLVGRKREMYKSGGYNVYPAEIERVIADAPGVASVCVVAVPDPLWQEVGVAFVTADARLNLEIISAFCRERLANYKIPKRFVQIGAMPLLPIGKVDKAALRERAQLSGHDDRDLSEATGRSR